jgi:hypothetical protein
MKPKRMTPEECVVELIKVIEEKAPVSSLEFGFDEDDPKHWWAKATTRSGRVRMSEVDVEHMAMGPVEALGELARELGLSVRIRPEIIQ